MKSPYAQPWKPLTQVNVKGPSAAESRAGDQASNTSNLLRLLSSSAPALGGLAGTAIGAGVGSLAGGVGAIPGAALGGAIGSGAGQLLGGLGGGAADEMTRPYEEADLKRRAKLDAIQRVLGGMT